MGKNLVIGIEGLVGTGKTSICKELLKQIQLFYMQEMCTEQLHIK